MSTKPSNHNSTNAGLESRQIRLPELLNFIDGQACKPEIDRHHQLCDANSGQALQAQLASSTEQIEVALSAADKAFQLGDWENLPALERADFLDKIANELDHAETKQSIAYADSITTGSIIRTTTKMANLAPAVFKGAAHYLREGHLDKKTEGPCGDVDHLLRPWGPALLVSPWNAPTAIGSHKVASALAAGAPCIAKPSEWAPHSAILVAQAIAKVGLPSGAFQLTLGDRSIGAQMLNDTRIKAVSFTGGLQGGRAVVRACAERFTPTQLELGGNNPLIVFEDADIEQAAIGIVYGLTNLNAQWCRALGRLIVHRSVKTVLLDRVLELLAEVQLGDSLSEQTDMGPMAHQHQFNSVLDGIDALIKKGGTPLSSTKLPDLNGYFVSPTLIDGCVAEDTIDEIFGPVAAIHCFDTDEQALQLANGTPFGLAGYVYSNNLERAFKFSRKMRTGGVKINGYSLLSIGKGTPRSAWGLSGIGEEGHAQSIEFFTGARVIGVSQQDALFGR